MKKKNKIEPVVSILDYENGDSDLKYWLEKTPEERIDAVLYLREQYMSTIGCNSHPPVEAVVKIISLDKDA